MLPAITPKELSTMSILSLQKSFYRWYWGRVERRANICAAVERTKAQQALHDVRHFEVKALLARTNKNRF